MTPGSSRAQGLRTLAALGEFVCGVLPQARAQARRWSRRADAIPSPALRAHAGHALRSEDVNVFAAAALALLAPRARRRTMVELLMSWRVICSYVDELSEQPAADPLRNGLQLHRALTDAVSPSYPAAGDYYAHHPLDDDDGYLGALVANCRLHMSALADAPGLEEVARVGARRCAEAQSHAHAAALTGSTREMRAWALREPADGDWEWWEVVAASVADLPIMAAVAMGDGTSGASPARVYDAYWPQAGALATLLDSVVDRERDAATGDYSFVANYPSDLHARERVATVATRARAATQTLPSSHIHRAIVAGVVAHYVTVPGRSGARATATLDVVSERLRPTITPILHTVRAYRAATRASRRGRRA